MGLEHHSVCHTAGLGSPAHKRKERRPALHHAAGVAARPIQPWKGGSNALFFELVRQRPKRVQCRRHPGALIGSTHVRRRSADVTVRIGTPALDNSHGNERSSAISSGVLPLEDNQDATAHELWRLTYEEYRKASKSYVKTGTRVRVQEEDPSPDFSQEKPEAYADYNELAPRLSRRHWRKWQGYTRPTCASTPTFFLRLPSSLRKGRACTSHRAKAAMSWSRARRSGSSSRRPRKLLTAWT
jgi:hypothetical protein